MVFYTVANIAQFERRQVSERVSANFQARAARGLYNGGVLPLGYKLIPEKPGYLETDEEMTETVRMAFKAFLQEETLSRAAKWLNANGYRVKREAKESKATWPAIVDEDIFNRVQKHLRENHCRKKPESEHRYPYQLTGLVNCSACGERMIGKSAHGRNGKIGYYEHGWSTRRQACLVKPVFDCKPFRLQAKKLEPAVWDVVLNYLKNPKAAHAMIQTAESLHKEKSKSSESKKLQEKVRSLEGQLEVLSEHLAQLPKTISPGPIFKQMEKIEALKAEEQIRLFQFQRTEGIQLAATPLADYDDLLRTLAELANSPKGQSARGKIIRTLVQRIEITPEGFKLHLHVGKDYIEGELAKAGSPLLKKKMFGGSNSLQNGGPTRT